MRLLKDPTAKRLSNSIVEASRRLNVSVPYVRGLIRSGQIRAVKFGRVWRIPEESLVELAHNGTSSDTKE